MSCTALICFDFSTVRCATDGGSFELTSGSPSRLVMFVEDRGEVQAHDAAVDRHGALSAFDDVHERLVGGAVGRLPGFLHPGGRERAFGDFAGDVAQPGKRPGERLYFLGQAFLISASTSTLAYSCSTR